MANRRGWRESVKEGWEAAGRGVRVKWSWKFKDDTSGYLQITSFILLQLISSRVAASSHKTLDI